MCVFKIAFIVSLVIWEIRGKNSHVWYSYQFDNGISNRDELVVTEVQADETFNLGRGVRMWKSISIGNQIFAIGVKDKGITLLNADLGRNVKFRINSQEIDFDQEITDLSILEEWNSVLQRPEPIVAITFLGLNPKLEWFKIVDSNKLEKIWQWNLHKSVHHINYFLHENRKYLLLICEHEKVLSADLYMFELGEQNFWLLHTIKLVQSTRSSSVNIYGKNCFISIPQKTLNTVFVYELSENQFISYKNLTSQFVDKITSFQIGSRSFLAINGFNAGIYEFKQDRLVISDIKPIDVDDSDLWLPLEINSYKDEVILLLQRSLVHDSHISLHVDALTFDGEKFLIHDEIPCPFYGINENGLTCMIDEEGQSGLLGSTVLSLGNTLGVLVPRKKEPSILFMFKIDLKPVVSPVDVQIDKIISAREQLQKMIDEQQSTIKSIQERLDNAIKTDESNTVSAPWTIHTLSLPVKENRSNDWVKSENLVDQTEPNVGLDDLEEELNNIAKKLEITKQNYNFTLNLNDSDHFFNNLILNDLLEVDGKSTFENMNVSFLNLHEATGTLNDIVNVQKNKSISATKIFKNLQVQELKFESLNGIPSNQILYADNNSVQIKGNLVFENPVRTKGAFFELVNGINLNSEIISTEEKYSNPEAIQFDHLIVDHLFAERLNNFSSPIIDDDSNFKILENQSLESLVIPDNLIVDKINGEHFDNILKTLCLTNIPKPVIGHTFMKKLHVIDEAHVKYLNQLRFPEEYITQRTSSKITGNKTFIAPIVVSDAFTLGKINGINTSDIITLDGYENFTNNFILHDLEVTESLKVEGKVFGSHLSEFLSNPSITKTTELGGNIIFKNLEVDGVVTILNDYNKNNFEDTLEDVLYRDKPNQVITSLKEFPEGFTVSNGLAIKSNSINNVFLDKLLSKNTERLELITLNGNVTIENLILEGLYQDINIIELDRQMVKLDGEQFISSTLIFNNDNDDKVDISATEFHITKTLNELEENEYFYTEGDRVFEKLNTQTMKADRVEVFGKIEGTVEGFDLDDFNSRRLSLSRNQTIYAPYKINNSIIHHLDAELINGVAYRKLFMFDSYVDEIREKLTRGTIKIKDLYVNGSINVKSLNGHDLDMISNSSMELNNSEPNNGIFQGNVYFESLDIEKYNGGNFDEFYQNIVFKDEPNVKIETFKIFTESISVNKLLSPERINNVKVDDILMRRGKQEMIGPLFVTGKVTVEGDTEISGTFNDVPIEYISKAFRKENDIYIINDDVFFGRLLQTERLFLSDFLNDIKVDEFLPNIVYFNSQNLNISNIIFNQPVLFESNLQVTGKTNNIDLSEFVNDVVFITSDEVIEEYVTFTKPVNVTGKLTIDKLNAELVSGVDIEKWKDDTMFINKGLIPEKLHFEQVTIQNNILVDRINDIHLKSLIQLRTDEYINTTLNFNEITPYRDIPVKNLVNNLKLEQEYQNTLMIGHPQEVHSNITFLGNVLVRDHLKIYGLVNDKNLSKVVTTFSDQNLTASYKFVSKTILESNLQLDGLFNGIEFNQWSRNLIRTNQVSNQSIGDVWNVTENVEFTKDVFGKGLLGNINVVNTSEAMEEKRKSRQNSERDLIENYENACKDVNYILHAAKNQVYKFLYFQDLQYLPFKSDIEAVHHFKFQSKDYLLISVTSTCIAYLYRWNNVMFELISENNVGTIEQIISVFDGDFIFLIIKNGDKDLKCEVTGSNIWSFEGEQLNFTYKLDHTKLLQESLIPGAFYTLSNDSVNEYQIAKNFVKLYRKWTVNTENAAFIPRGLGTGLALRNGQRLIKLFRTDLAIEDEDFGYETESYINGNFTIENNNYLPGRDQGDVIVLNVGGEENQRSLAAVSSHEETSVKGRLDFIKVYEDVISGTVFHKVPAYKPSSLISLEFGNSGETLLVFLENEKTLQVYEYKGIEGFKHKSSVKMDGSKLITMKLYLRSINDETTFIGMVNKKRFNIIEAVMAGNQIQEDNPVCEL